MRIFSSVGTFLKPKSINVIVYNIIGYRFLFLKTHNKLSEYCTQANKLQHFILHSGPHLDNSTSSSISSSDSSDEESSLGGCHWFFICSAFILFISFSDCCYSNRNRINKVPVCLWLWNGLKARLLFKCIIVIVSDRYNYRSF